MVAGVFSVNKLVNYFQADWLDFTVNKAKINMLVIRRSVAVIGCSSVVYGCSVNVGEILYHFCITEAIGGHIEITRYKGWILRDFFAVFVNEA